MPCYNCGYTVSVVSKDEIGWLCEWCSDNGLRSPVIRFLMEEFKYYDNAFKTYSDLDDFKIAQVLQRILRSQNKNA